MLAEIGPHIIVQRLYVLTKTGLSGCKPQVFFFGTPHHQTYGKKNHLSRLVDTQVHESLGGKTHRCESGGSGIKIGSFVGSFVEEVNFL